MTIGDKSRFISDGTEWHLEEIETKKHQSKKLIQTVWPFPPTFFSNGMLPKPGSALIYTTKQQ